MGGIIPNAEFLSFSDLDFTKGTRGGRGDSVRSAMGEGGDCVLGMVIFGSTLPVLRVLLLRRVMGEVDGPTRVPGGPPLLDPFPEPGDLGEVGWGLGFSTETAGEDVGALVRTGRAADPEDRRCCEETIGGPPSGDATF
jgi:hypothetical protein